MDKILRFKNTFIIIMINLLLMYFTLINHYGWLGIKFIYLSVYLLPV